MRTAVILAAAIPLLVAADARGQTRPDPAEPPLSIDAAARARLIRSLAAELEAGYVFPDVAAAMSRAIRGKLKDGEYDKLDTGQALARRLTEDLRAIAKDKHLAVECSTRPLPPKPAKGRTPEEAARRREETHKRNAGFVRLERLPGNVGYLDLRGFEDAEAGAETAAAAMTFLAHTDALIIDLRKNGGGSPGMARLLCSYLLPGDRPVLLWSIHWRREDRTDEYWTLRELPGRRYADREVYVLTSRRTFSAGEGFAHVLQSRKRATVVGEVTGGGAHPGRGAPLDDHFVAHIPAGRVVNPVTQSDWEGTGVKPDVAADAGRALEVAHGLAVQKLWESASGPEARNALERDLAAEGVLEKLLKGRKSE
jgi:C-terminal processing protease CtpA/Prc